MSWLEILKAAGEAFSNAKLADPTPFKPNGFRAVDRGIIYSVDNSREIARADVKWVYQSRSYGNPTSGATDVERGQVEVRDAFGLAKPSVLTDEQRGLFYDNGNRKYFLHGVLFLSEHRRPFLVVQAESKCRIATFQAFDEFQHWCEKHLSVDQYIEVFQANSSDGSSSKQFTVGGT